MKVLVTGAQGQLGSELQATCPENVEILATDREQLDITSLEAIQQFLDKHQPNIVINAAAYTAVDKAETDQDNAYAVNHIAALNLAQACTQRAIYLIHVSTDFVFDGSQNIPYAVDALTSPIGVYGESKLYGEQAVQEYAPTAAIIRTSWLYSIYGNNFVKTMLRLMRDRDSIGVIYDQVGTPTWTHTLALTIWEFTKQRPQGIFHCADNGVASWYDFALAIQEEAIALELLTKTIPVKPLRTVEYPTPAKRPAFSVMDKRLTEQLLGDLLPHWRVSLRHMLQTLKTTAN